MGIVKTCIRAPFRAVGYDIVHLAKPDYTWLQELGIRTLLDIGANVGQYASLIRAILPQAQIYSFEPIESCFRQLNERMQNDTRFKAFQYALGDRPGKTQINRNEHTPASSLLKMADLHRRHYAYAVVTEPETICVECLDDIAVRLDLEPPLMLKIDVQGYEDKVIAGGVKTIRKAKLVVVETSFEELYKGQPLFDTIYEKMKGLGFVYHGSNHQVRSATERRVLQENSVFIRS